MNEFKVYVCNNCKAGACVAAKVALTTCCDLEDPDYVQTTVKMSEPVTVEEPRKCMTCGHTDTSWEGCEKRGCDTITRAKWIPRADAGKPVAAIKPEAVHNHLTFMEDAMTHQNKILTNIAESLSSMRFKI